MSEAASRGEVSPVHVAMLEDRIRVNEGKGQRYGTQFDWDRDGQMNPLPMDDESNVDVRRAEVGLPPLADDIRRHRHRMADYGNRTLVPPPAPGRSFTADEELVIGWLSRVRGLDATDPSFKPFPRPVGAATRAVVSGALAVLTADFFLTRLLLRV